MMNLAILDAAAEQERLQNKLTEREFYKIKDKLEQLKNIVTRYRIKFDKDMFSTDDALLESFIENKQNAFLKFKENSNVSRTLVSEKFKQKEITGNERKV